LIETNDISKLDIDFPSW